MNWNRGPDLTPLPHFSKHDSRNLAAAHARRAEIRAGEGRSPGRPKGINNRTTTLSIAVTAAEYATIRDYAAREGIFIAAVVREAVAGFCRGRPEHAENVAAARTLRAQELRKEDWELRLSTRDSGCRFPIGDPRGPEFRFCNEEVVGIGPYCAGHRELCSTRRHS